MDAESTEQPEREMTDQEAVVAVLRHAVSLVAAGRSRAQVRADLESLGMSAETARIVTTRAFSAHAQVASDAGRKNMLYGALWCIGGVIVTVLSYQSAASSPMGGRYVVAYGAIIVGAIQFFRGLAQSSGR